MRTEDPLQRLDRTRRSLAAGNVNDHPEPDYGTRQNHCIAKMQQARRKPENLRLF